LYPPQKAIIKAKIELTTEEKALEAHAQGISLFSFFPSNRIPVGKGKPMRKPRGKIIKKVKIILKISFKPIKYS
jgi:hypothetical protein